MRSVLLESLVSDSSFRALVIVGRLKFRNLDLVQVSDNILI
jgi:hypothetical protein